MCKHKNCFLSSKARLSYIFFIHVIYMNRTVSEKCFPHLHPLLNKPIISKSKNAKGIRYILRCYNSYISTKDKKNQVQSHIEEHVQNLPYCHNMKNVFDQVDLFFMVFTPEVQASCCTSQQAAECCTNSYLIP